MVEKQRRKRCISRRRRRSNNRPAVNRFRSMYGNEKSLVRLPYGRSNGTAMIRRFLGARQALECGPSRQPATISLADCATTIVPQLENYANRFSAEMSILRSDRRRPAIDCTIFDKNVTVSANGKPRANANRTVPSARPNHTRRNRSARLANGDKKMLQ